MRYGDIVNLVNESSTENTALVGQQWEKEFVAAQGIDFVYDDASRTLRIRIRHSRVLEQNELASMKLNSNAVLLVVADNVIPRFPINNEGRQWRNQLVPGTLLLRQGDLMEVTRVHGDDVVLISDGTDEKTTINIIEAEQLLEEYIG